MDRELANLRVTGIPDVSSNFVSDTPQAEQAGQYSEADKREMLGLTNARIMYDSLVPRWMGEEEYWRAKGPGLWTRLRRNRRADDSVT